jgi:hypothetical protein
MAVHVFYWMRLETRRRRQLFFFLNMLGRAVHDPVKHAGEG